MRIHMVAEIFLCYNSANFYVICVDVSALKEKMLTIEAFAEFDSKLN